MADHPADPKTGLDKVIHILNETAKVLAATGVLIGCLLPLLAVFLAIAGGIAYGIWSAIF